MRKLLPILALSLSLHAQTPYLVKDINTTYAQNRASSNPTQFTVQGNRLYFIATTQTAGTELWTSDGATTSVLDLISGTPGANPSALRAGLGALIFNARDVNHGVELWTTDGTVAGSRMLLDINPGPSSSDASLGILHRNRWIFSADNGTNGRELWITDGTASGTRLLKDIEPGTASSTPRFFAALGDAVYFIAANGLWKTDGTENGTVKIAPLIARNLVAAGTQLFLEAATAETGYELWVSDGTENGTRMLPEIYPGVFGALTNQGIIPAGSRVFFVANDGVHGREIWVSNGTAAGTHIVKDMTAGATGAWDNTSPFLIVLGDRAYFGTSDAEHGYELWVTDGTDAGTKVFIDLRPGPDSASAFPLTAIGGKLFFSADGPSPRYERNLWITDGTVNGTREVKAADGVPFDYDSGGRAADGKLYFAASTALNGVEPWTSDGTDAGTRMIANLGVDLAPSGSPRMFASTTNGLLFFHATEGLLSPTSNVAEASLWRTDGTAAGTFKLRETGQHPAALTGAGQYVFFRASINGTTWMRSDGTANGTRTADDFLLRFGGGNIMKFFPFGDTLFAAVGDSFNDTLWKTTAAPHQPAIQLGSRHPYDLVDVGGKYMFYAESPESIHDRGLWITDGTPGGTYAVVPHLGADYGGVGPIASAQGLAFFVMSQDYQPAKLWTSDGTLDGTVPIKEIPGAGSRVEMDSTGRRIFILTGNALWTSDGTEAGTVEVTKAHVFSPGYEPYMHAVGDRVVFAVYDEGNSVVATLWGSDGTQAGTKALGRLRASSMASIDGVVYFTGIDEAHGAEIWTTDGTVEGTKLLFDLSPGPGGSSPTEYKKAGNTLYFDAYTAGTGTELWALPLTAPRLSVRDARADESSQAVRFTVMLDGTPQQTVSVDYTTSNGTASAGQDYAAKSGTLTFAAGETTKTIDVPVLGDASTENNETFALTFANANGAELLNGGVTGIIDDDDQYADLAAEAKFSGNGFDLNTGVLVSNHGPRGATEVSVTFTSLGREVSNYCSSCAIPQIANGGTAETYPPAAFDSGQSYRSAIVRSRQSDPNPANNAASWTITDFEDMAMNAAYLTPGQTATVSAEIFSNQPYPAPLSIDPSIVSISSPATTVDGVAQFTVTAQKPGETQITVGGNRQNLSVTVVAAGATPRWPNGLVLQTGYSAGYIGEPVTLTITPEATAPVTGARATGLVTVTANGQELARHNVTHAEPVTVPIYFRNLGSINYQISYSGDANFLPQTVNASIYMRQGTAVITGVLQRDPDQDGAHRLKVQLTGGPGLAPTGSVRLFNDGQLKGTLTLTPSADGTSRAEASLTGLAGSPDITVQVEYPGDSLYGVSIQRIRFVAPRRRNVRH